MKNIHKIFYVALILCWSVCSEALEHISDRGFEKINNIINIVKKNYVKPVSEEKLIDSAIGGILNSLDSHAHFYDEKDWQEINKYSSGEFSGVGLELRVDDGKAFVVMPVKTGPAARAGVVAGDQIISIDGKSVAGKSRQSIIKALSGRKGTQLSLAVIRSDNTIEPVKFSIMRERISLHSIKSELLLDGIFYLRITAFYENTIKAMQRAALQLKELETQNKLKGVIIDLRDNSGGLLQSAVDVASFFVERGNLVSIFSPRMSREVKYFAKRTFFKLKKDIPVAVLINRQTASAAEVLAAALKNYRKATIIGEKSFGKGSVQMFFPLETGGAISITTAFYKTSTGDIIEKNGIIPDIDASDMSSSRVAARFMETKDYKEKSDFSNNRFIINKAIIIMSRRNT